MTKKNPPNLDDIFEALANQHRREIVHCLGLQPCSISKLAQIRKLSLPAIHKHVKVLEKAHLVKREKISRTNFLSLKRDNLIILQKWVMQFHPYWGAEDQSNENYKDYLNKVDLKGGE